MVDRGCWSGVVGMNMGIEGVGRGDIEGGVVGGVSLVDGDGDGMFDEGGVLCEKL